MLRESMYFNSINLFKWVSIEISLDTYHPEFLLTFLLILHKYGSVKEINIQCQE